MSWNNTKMKKRIYAFLKIEKNFLTIQININKINKLKKNNGGKLLHVYTATLSLKLSTC